jgi:hypothetical protein
MRIILNAVDYKGRHPGLSFAPDPEGVVSGAREIALMDAQRRGGGKFTD